jgi:hypothetical protein
MRTTYCCQGSPTLPGYVAFRGIYAVTFVAAMLKEMAATFAERWTTYKLNNRTHGHDFRIHLGEGPLSIAFLPGTYPLVLEAARKAIEKVQTVEKMTSDFMERPVVPRPVVAKRIIANFDGGDSLKKTLDDTVAAFRDGSLKG